MIQRYSEKCTGRYFKVRDDDLSSKQGSLVYIQNDTYNNYSKIFLLYIKLKHYNNMNNFLGGGGVDRLIRD